MSDNGPRRRTRQRSVHCTPEEQEAIRASARAAGKTVSRHILDLVRADDSSGRHPLALSPSEQQAMLESLRQADDFVQALLRPLPGYGGLTLPGAVARLLGAEQEQ